MKAIWRWIRDALTETAARSVALILLGGLATAASGLLAFGVSRFFSQQVQVSVALLSILSLFALIGLLAGALPLWRLVSSGRRHPSAVALDERLEAATEALLRRLAEVEAGKQLWIDSEVSAYRAETHALFDAWETQVRRHLPPGEWNLTSQLRDEIGSRSLHHSQAEAKDWIRRVKSIADKARSNVSY
jgi:hypothetical protein